MNFIKHGYIRVAIASNNLEIANPSDNVKDIIEKIDLASEKDVEILVFSELAITSCSLNDLVFDELLLDESLKALKKIVDYSKSKDSLIFIGLPVKIENSVYSIIAAIQNNKILSFIPVKSKVKSISNNIETIVDENYLFYDTQIPINNNVVFKDKSSDLKIEIISNFKDSFNTNSHIIIHVDSDNEEITKKEKRLNYIKTITELKNVAYIYKTANESETTTNIIYSSHSIIKDDNSLVENYFNNKTDIIYSDIDYKSIIFKQRNTKTNPNIYNNIITFNRACKNRTLLFNYDKLPFLKELNSYKEVLNLQARAYMQRMKKTNIINSVIGVSGGLDSTWALIVIIEAHKLLNNKDSKIYAFSLPGFATSNRTLENISKLMNAFNLEYKTIDIKENLENYYESISYTKKNDLLFENSQARQRTKILMDIANYNNAMVVGTGDLSEIALGWSTFNADHMSMYSVNSNIPKTMIKHLIKLYSLEKTNSIKEALNSVLNTPISPELLPTKDGEINHLTEEIVGKYSLIDFFLYHYLNSGFTPEKIYEISKVTFEELDEEYIKNTLLNFFKRFITQQFKKNSSPDSVKVLNISLLKDDYQIVSDASYKMWYKNIKGV